MSPTSPDHLDHLDHLDRPDRPAPPASPAFRAIAFATLVVTIALIALGGAVRATDSGLACPDWPWCYGKIIPMQADIPPESGYTLWNVWLEHSHRLTASVVGFGLAALAIWVLRRHRHQPGLLWPVLIGTVAVVVQAALGAMVVLHLLRAELVTAHLGMSMVVLACLILAVVNASAPPPSAAPADQSARRSLRGPAIAVAVIAYVQILIGGQVTGMHAGLVYGLDPLRFNGSLLPPVPETTAEGYHLVHRVLAVVVAVAVIILAALVERRHRRWVETVDHPGPPTSVRIAAWAAVAVVVLQIGLGAANLMQGTPPALVTAHLAAASWIWTAVFAIVVFEWRHLARLANTSAEPEPPLTTLSATPDELTEQVPASAS